MCARCSKTTVSDGPFYAVVCGDANDCYMPERKVSACTWAQTVADITAMQFDDLLQVIEIGTGVDRTEQMLRAAMTLWAQDGDPISPRQRRLIELHIGVHAANSFRMVA